MTQELALKTLPTPNEVWGAVHQPEGLILTTDTDQEYSLVPKELLVGETTNTLRGQCWRRVGNKFTDGRPAVLTINPSEKTAYLKFED